MNRLPANILAVIGMLVWGLAPCVACAQTVTRVGSTTTLDVGSWNVEQFQAADPQMAHVVATMEQSGVDLWALQEVTSPGVLTELLLRLGSDWDGRLSTSTNLHTAFVFRKDVVGIRSTGPMFTPPSFEYEFAGRPPQVLDANVTVADSLLRILFVTVHMKCCSDRTSYDRRKAAATAMKNRLDFLRADDRVVVLGDFNDETGNSITFGQPSPYAGFVADSNYEFLIADGVVGTFCGSDSSCRTGSTIDNVLISSELAAAYLAGTGDRYDQLLSELPNYVHSTSDHLPVLARFDFTTMTATDTPAPPLPLPEVWPVPAQGFLHVDAPTTTTVELVDLLGRSVFQSVIHGQSGIDTSALPVGVYLLRLRSDRGVHTRLIPIAQ